MKQNKAIPILTSMGHFKSSEGQIISVLRRRQGPHCTFVIQGSRIIWKIEAGDAQSAEEQLISEFGEKCRAGIRLMVSVMNKNETVMTI